MIAQHPTDSPEALAAIAATTIRSAVVNGRRVNISEPTPKHVWIHGSITYIYTGEDIPPVVQGE